MWVHCLPGVVTSNFVSSELICSFTASSGSLKSIIKGGNVLRACNRCQCCQAAGQLFTERRNESDFGCQRSTVSLHSKSPDLFLEIATLSAT